MRMRVAVLTAVFLWSAIGAAESKYIYTNHRLDYVKLESISKKELADTSPTHPATISVEKMSQVLASLKVSRKLLLRKEVAHQAIYNDRAIAFLAPKLVEAFQKASPEEAVVFGWLTKDPEFIIRNDRFTAAKAWVKGNEIHVEFLKLHAKLTGDYDKRGNFDKAVNRARSLHIELETEPGQMLGASNAKEVIVDMTHTFAMETPVAPEAKKATVTITPAPTATPSVKNRLQELEKLHRAKLLTDEEYRTKRQEVLQNL